MSDLRAEIINKSFFLFLNKGYKACSLKDLERVTGLTRGAFYYYFRNKEDILQAGIEKYLSIAREMDEEEVKNVPTLREYMERVVRDKEKVADTLQQVFDFFIIEACFFQLILEVSLLFPVYREQIDDLSKNRLSRWEYMILRAKQTGEIQHTIDTSVLARNLLSVETSMINIELSTENFRFAFADMRLQLEQYYLLIKR